MEEKEELSRDQRFESFVKELNMLSVKYGVLIQCVGGLEVLSEADFRCLSRVRYSQDPDSGDLTFESFYRM